MKVEVFVRQIHEYANGEFGPEYPLQSKRVRGYFQRSMRAALHYRLAEELQKV
jgi:hypothetical protein